MYQLSNNQLNSLLLDAISSKNLYYNRTATYFQDLYMTGCRSTELLSMNQWRFIHGLYELTTHKTGEVRTLPQYLLSEHWRRCYHERLQPYSQLTYDQLTLEFRKVICVHPVFVGKKIADTYLFRYNRARQLFEQSHNYNLVMNFFGWRSLSVCNNYIHQPLEYNREIPF